MNIRSPLVSPFLCCGWLLLALTCVRLPSARADEASKAAVINELFAVMHVDTLMQESMRQGVLAQKAQFEKIEPFKSNKAALDEVIERMTALLAEKMSWGKLKPAMTKLYSDNFSEEELAASLAFYKTPAGQAMLTKLPVVMAGSIAIAQQQVGNFGPDIQQMMQDIMEKYPTPKTDSDN